MKKILVVFTGGTIGSSIKNGTINTSDKNQFTLLSQYEQQYHQAGNVRFTCIQALQILSENMHPNAWQSIISAIEKEGIGRYDGIIVTHGTDTLAYTAAALGLYFNQLAIPLLLVSSNYPLDDAKANGLKNFNCAVEFILQKLEQGVFVPYQNPEQTMLVHYATRMASSYQLSGDFYSVQHQAYLEFKNSRFNKLNPATENCQSATLKADFSANILLIRPYPGLDYSRLNINNVSAVLHDCYHSGTACSAEQWGGNYSLKTFIKRCQKENTAIYLAPAIKCGNTYQSTQELVTQGAEMIWNMSIEAAYAKLMLAYGNFTNRQQISDFLNTDIAQEHV